MTNYKNPFANAEDAEIVNEVKNENNLNQAEKEIAVVLRTTGVNEETTLSIKNTFMSFFDKVEPWIEQAKMINVTSEDQVEDMKLARALRLALRGVRIQADKVRKDMKDESLRYGKAVQGVYNIIEYTISPIEKRLEEQEKFAEIQEQKRKDALAEARLSEVNELIELGFIPDGYNYGNMSEEDYQRLLKMGNKMKQEASAEAKRKEEERLAKEKAEKEEQERIRKENEKLKKEAEERDRLAKIEAEKRAKEDAERIAKEEKEREAHELQLKKEREAREKLEKEKAEAERLEKERLEKEAETKRQAELSPDKDKLIAFAKLLLNIEKPTLKNGNANAILSLAIQKLENLSSEIIEKSKTL